MRAGPWSHNFRAQVDHRLLLRPSAVNGSLGSVIGSAGRRAPLFAWRRYNCWTEIVFCCRLFVELLLRPSIHPPSTIPTLRAGQARKAGVEGVVVFCCGLSAGHTGSVSAWFGCAWGVVLRHGTTFSEKAERRGLSCIRKRDVHPRLQSSCGSRHTRV